MPISSRVITGLAVYAALNAAENFHLRRKSRRLNRSNVVVQDLNNILIDASCSLLEALETQTERTEYLMHICEQNNIEFDEFDLIVLTNRPS